MPLFRGAIIAGLGTNAGSRNLQLTPFKPFSLSFFTFCFFTLRGTHYGLSDLAREPRETFAGSFHRREENASCGNYAFASLVRAEGRGDKTLRES